MIVKEEVGVVKETSEEVLRRFADFGARSVYEEDDFAILQFDAFKIFRSLTDPVSLVITTYEKLEETLPKDEYWLDTRLDGFIGSNLVPLILGGSGNQKNMQRLIDKTIVEGQPILRLEQLTTGRNPSKAFRDAVLDKITDLETTLSPYRINRCAPTSMFFGREKQLIRLRRAQGNHIITGARRIGKSTLATHLRDELGKITKRSRLLGISDNEMFKCSYVDVSAMGDRASEGIWGQIIRNFKLDVGKLLRYRRKLKLSDNRHDERTYIDSEARMLDRLISQFPGELTIILDEVDGWIASEAANGWTVMDQLRALTDEGRARVILVGYETLITAVGNDRFPLGARGDTMILTPLDRESTNHLVKDPLAELNLFLEQEPEMLETIWRETSGVPHLVQDICGFMVGMGSGMRGRNKRYLTNSDLNAAILNSEPIRQFRRGVFDSDFPLAKAIAGMTSYVLTGGGDGRRRRESVPHLERSSYYGKSNITTGGIRELLDDAGYEYDGEEFKLAMTYLELRLILKPLDIAKTLWGWVNGVRREMMVNMISGDTYPRWEKDMKKAHQEGSWRRRYKVLGRL
jgi:hypothetical protein